MVAWIMAAEVRMRMAGELIRRSGAGCGGEGGGGGLAKACDVGSWGPVCHSLTGRGVEEQRSFGCGLVGDSGK